MGPLTCPICPVSKSLAVWLTSPPPASRPAGRYCLCLRLADERQPNATGPPRHVGTRHHTPTPVCRRRGLWHSPSPWMPPSVARWRPRCVSYPCAAFALPLHRPPARARLGPASPTHAPPSAFALRRYSLARAPPRLEIGGKWEMGIGEVGAWKRTGRGRAAVG